MAQRHRRGWPRAAAAGRAALVEGRATHVLGEKFVGAASAADVEPSAPLVAADVGPGAPSVARACRRISSQRRRATRPGRQHQRAGKQAQGHK